MNLFIQRWSMPLVTIMANSLTKLKGAILAVHNFHVGIPDEVEWDRVENALEDIVLENRKGEEINVEYGSGLVFINGDHHELGFQKTITPFGLDEYGEKFIVLRDKFSTSDSTLELLFPMDYLTRADEHGGFLFLHSFSFRNDKVFLGTKVKSDTVKAPWCYRQGELRIL